MAESGSHVGLSGRDEPLPLGRRHYGRCTFCESPDTVWQHDLNTSLCTFRTMFDKGTVWASSQKLCEQCEQLYNAGEYAGLARLQTGQPPYNTDELNDHLIGLAAFCRADRGARELEQPDFPPGFEPWEEFTDADFVFGIWPEQRRMVVNGVELVASPWPSLELTAVFSLLWSWVERDRDHEITESVIIGRAAEALGWPESQTLTWLASQE